MSEKPTAEEVFELLRGVERTNRQIRDYRDDRGIPTRARVTINDYDHGLEFLYHYERSPMFQDDPVMHMKHLSAYLMTAETRIEQQFNIPVKPIAGRKPFRYIGLHISRSVVQEELPRADSYKKRYEELREELKELRYEIEGIPTALRQVADQLREVSRTARTYTDLLDAVIAKAEEVEDNE